jgi:hypothetical protein
MEGKCNRQTFKNDGLVWYPEVAESPPILISFEKYPARLIGENTDLIVLKILDRVDAKITPVCLLRGGET